MPPLAAALHGPALPPRLYLVAADWQSRALSLAELQERGHEVLALPGIVWAEKALAAGRIAPRAIAIDVHGDPDASPERVRALRRRAPHVPMMLVVGAWEKDAYAALAGELDVILCRPVSVGDVVAAIERLLERPPAPTEPAGAGRA